MASEHLLAELRRPGAPMKSTPLKLPADRLEQLHRQANRLQAYPSALARALVVHGLDRLEQEVG
jgi:hypothetical protein